MRILLGIAVMAGYFSLSVVIVSIAWIILDAVLKDNDGATNLKMFLLIAGAFVLSEKMIGTAISSRVLGHIVSVAATAGIIFLSDKIKDRILKR